MPAIISERDIFGSSHFIPVFLAAESPLFFFVFNNFYFGGAQLQNNFKLQSVEASSIIITSKSMKV
jgi:hypothetical protein